VAFARSTLLEACAHQLAVRQRGEGIVMGEERYALLGDPALADVAEFEQARCALAVRDGARRDLDRDDRTGAAGHLGIEPQLALAKQPLDHVGIADERRDHQMRRVLMLDPDEAAQAGIDRDRLHAGAKRDTFVEHVEQRVQRRASSAA